MHRLATAGLVPVLLTLLATAAGAQPVAPQVSEAELLSALTASHPAVAALRRPVADAEAGVVAASTRANPLLGVDREDPDGAEEQLELTLSWALPRSSRRLEIESAERDLETAEARLEADVLDLRLALRRLYAGWAVAHARGERLAAQADRLARLAERERARAERGEASQLEARRLTLAAAGLRARQAVAAAEALKARAGARGWVSDLPADAVPVLPALPPVTELGGPHPRLAAAASELAAAETAVKAAGRFLATPELTAGWQRQDAGATTVGGPLLGLSWSLPLFSRNQASRARAEARLEAARARLETVRREIEAERAGAVEAYRQLRRAAAEAAAATDADDRLLTGAVAAFRHGEAGLTDLLDTLRSIAEAEATALDLHAAALAAHRDLERLAGRSLDPLPQRATP